MEVNCTETSPSVRLPCPHAQILFNVLLFSLAIAAGLKPSNLRSFVGCSTFNAHHSTSHFRPFTATINFGFFPFILIDLLTN